MEKVHCQMLCLIVFLVPLIFVAFSISVKNIEAKLVSLGVKEHNNISSTVLESKKEQFTRWVFRMPPAKICSMLFWLHCRNRELEGNKKSVGHRVSVIGCFIEPG